MVQTKRRTGCRWPTKGCWCYSNLKNEANKSKEAELHIMANTQLLLATTMKNIWCNICFW